LDRGFNYLKSADFFPEFWPGGWAIYISLTIADRKHI